MSIAILPARLANQIAAGEVVERPASVIKELVENSLDAGATRIQIDIEKGGAKRIRIIDNGKGIDKDELTLALSRHATSKIKNLDDLEAISSLGFRGEALASISSVARLTLTSKPPYQAEAWQAHAEGRDMDVVIQPAAHPDGTTIDVTDLFFNTPARRKFLRTEKTEFAHIEEVIKRIALARFDVTFVLNHNGKPVKNYRRVNDQSQSIKRIGAVCGQAFVDNAITIDCQHDNIHLWGWVAKPSYTRKQNDLCYSYVNGRMMRDKLINHAIRQAYGEFIENDVYSAFVLFLSLDFKEVDVNVHPAKHEVRFHQGRYVHDFIYSVCHKALAEQIELEPEYSQENEQSNYFSSSHQHIDSNYIQPLQQVSDVTSARYDSSEKDGYQKNQPQERSHHSTYSQAQNYASSPVSKVAVENYQQLMTVAPNAKKPDNLLVASKNKVADTEVFNFLCVYEDIFILFQHNENIKICQIKPLFVASQIKHIEECWQNGLVSQPLLLPVRVKTNVEQVKLLQEYEALLISSGIHIHLISGYAQIRQFPAILREHDVTVCFEKVLIALRGFRETENDSLSHWMQFLAKLSAPLNYPEQQVKKLWQALNFHSFEEFNTLVSLNSEVIDLTSAIQKITSAAQT